VGVPQDANSILDLDEGQHGSSVFDLVRKLEDGCMEPFGTQGIDVVTREGSVSPVMTLGRNGGAHASPGMWAATHLSLHIQGWSKKAAGGRNTKRLFEH
jgi:hypothetical protein